MKKVLFVATVVKKHINVFHLPTLKLFKEHGYETSVCARNDFENKIECIIPYCDHYYDIPFERNPIKINNINCYKKIKDLIDTEKYDIIYCHTPVGAMIARLASRHARKIYNTKVIYMAHGFHFYNGAPILNWLVYYPVERLLSKYTDTLITINREDYQRALKFKAKKVEYVPGVGIDLSRFYCDEDIRINKRKELNINNDDIALLSVGELTKRKNHLAVIEAIKQINDVNLKYFICGTGPLKKKILKKINKYHLDNQVFLLGFRKDIVDICNACDLFVFPSLQEGLPVALMEAMACGMPVICSNIRGNVDLIANGENGFIFSKQENSINIIKKCINDNSIKQMGYSNLQKIKDYDIRIILKELEDIFFNNE